MARNCSRGWAERCQTAKGSICICDCGGDNHGKLNEIGSVAKDELEDVKNLHKPNEEVA